MALTSELNLEGLIAADAYWRIGELYWNANDPSTLAFRVDGYASTAAYESGHGAIASRIVQIELPLDQLDNPRTSLFNQVRAMAYGIIKGDVPEFEGSTDA